VFESEPTTEGAEDEPSTPEMPVEPFNVKAIIKE